METAQTAHSILNVAMPVAWLVLILIVAFQIGRMIIRRAKRPRPRIAVRIDHSRQCEIGECEIGECRVASRESRRLMRNRRRYSKH